MYKVVDPKQTRLFDPFDDVLTEKTRQRLLGGVVSRHPADVFDLPVAADRSTQLFTVGNEKARVEADWARGRCDCPAHQVQCGQIRRQIILPPMVPGRITGHSGIARRAEQ